MSFRPFHDLCPGVAERETRTITVFPKSDVGLPAGNYGFVEMFCDEVGCDCRRVFFYVISEARRNVEAVVAWGWEDVDFYTRWLKYGTAEEAELLQGPVLNLGSPETELAPAVLALVRNVLLRDAAYVERVKRHYRMFRAKIDAPARKQVRKRRKRP